MLQWIVFNIHDNSPTINNEHNRSSKYIRSFHNNYINEKKIFIKEVMLIFMAQVKTTVLFPFTSTLFSACHLTALANTIDSISLPFLIRSSMLS